MTTSQQIEIQVPDSALFALFESDSIREGMTHSIPGGVLRLGPMPMQKRTHEFTLALVPVIVTISTTVSLNLLSNYIYSKLTSRKITRIKINRKEVEVTPEGILKTIEETIEIETK